MSSMAAPGVPAWISETRQITSRNLLPDDNETAEQTWSNYGHSHVPERQTRDLANGPSLLATGSGGVVRLQA